MIKNNKRKDFLVVRVLAKDLGPTSLFHAVPGRSPQDLDDLRGRFQPYWFYIGASAGTYSKHALGPRCPPRQCSKSCYNSLLGESLELFGFQSVPELLKRRSVCLPTSGLPGPEGAVAPMFLVSVGAWNICSVWALCNSRRSMAWMSDGKLLECRDIYGEAKGRRHSICSLFSWLLKKVLFAN